MEEGEANICSVSHIPTLLGPQEFITFSTRKCEVGHLMLVYQPQRLLNIKSDVPHLKFIDLNSWIEDGDFGGDGLHQNGRGKRRLGQLYARVSGLDVGGSAKSKK